MGEMKKHKAGTSHGICAPRDADIGGPQSPKRLLAKANDIMLRVGMAEAQDFERLSQVCLFAVTMPVRAVVLDDEGVLVGAHREHHVGSEFVAPRRLVAATAVA
jgi:hypothetical protein